MRIGPDRLRYSSAFLPHSLLYPHQSPHQHYHPLIIFINPPYQLSSPFPKYVPPLLHHPLHPPFPQINNPIPYSSHPLHNSPFPLPNFSPIKPKTLSISFDPITYKTPPHLPIIFLTSIFSLPPTPSNTFPPPPILTTTFTYTITSPISHSPSLTSRNLLPHQT